MGGSRSYMAITERSVHAETNTGWNLESLQTAESVDRNLVESFAQPMLPAGALFDGMTLDDLLLPVAADMTPASSHWSTLRNSHYELRDTVTSDEQVVYTFAQCMGAVLPNELPHGAAIAKCARYMRAMQAGVDFRLRAVKPNVYRDASEAYMARLLFQARKYLEGSPLLAFDQARQAAGLNYGPARFAKAHKDRLGAFFSLTM